MVDLLIPTSGFRELTIEEILDRKRRIDDAAALERSVSKLREPQREPVSRIVPNYGVIENETAKYAALVIDGSKLVDLGDYNAWIRSLKRSMMTVPDLYHGFPGASEILQAELRTQFEDCGIITDTVVRRSSGFSGLDYTMLHGDVTCPSNADWPVGAAPYLFDYHDEHEIWGFVRTLFDTDDDAENIKRRLLLISGGNRVYIGNFLTTPVDVTHAILLCKSSSSNLVIGTTPIDSPLSDGDLFYARRVRR